MKKDIPRLVPIWLIISILIIFITQCGCITKRGHGLGGGYIKGEDGVYRKPKSSQTIQPAKPSEAKQVPLKSPYEPPNTEIIKKHSASPTPIKPKDVKSSGKPEKLAPIIPETKKKIELGLITIELPEDNEDERTNIPDGSNDNDAATAKPTENTDKMKVNWGDLIIFYLNAALALFFIYFLYKLIKGHILWKGSDMKEHIEKMKTKKTRKTRSKTK